LRKYRKKLTEHVGYLGKNNGIIIGLRD
jgi:hypothetical protein